MKGARAVAKTMMALVLKLREEVELMCENYKINGNTEELKTAAVECQRQIDIVQKAIETQTL